MKRIIKKIARFCGLVATPRQELSFDEQVQLFEEGTCRQFKKAIKKQTFDDAVLMLLADSSCEDFLEYELLCFYYERHGFTREMMLYLLHHPRYEDFAYLLGLIRRNYGFVTLRTDGETELSVTCQALADLLEQGDDAVVAFFGKVKLIDSLLNSGMQIKYEKECRKTAVLAFPLSGFSDSYLCYLSYSALPMTDSNELKKDIISLLPSVEVQCKIMDSGNELWIETLIHILVKTEDVWNEVFGGFEDGLLSEKVKRFINK